MIPVAKTLSYTPSGFGKVKVEILSEQYDSENDIFVPDANDKVSGTVKIKQIEPRNMYNADDIDIDYVDLILNSTQLERVTSPTVNTEYEFEIDTSSLSEDATFKLSLLFDIYSRTTYPQVGQRTLVAADVSGQTDTATISHSA